MRRILVTGASGFVGRHLRVALREAFPAATLIAATRGEAVEGWDAAIGFDLSDPASPRAALGEAAPDAVVHLAAQAAVAESFRDPLGAWRLNLMGTVALGEAIREAAPDALLLHASSAEVYGLSFQRDEPLDEAAPLLPANPYAASKAAADLALGELALRGLRVVRLRPVNHTGAGQAAGFVVAAFARQVARIEAGLQEPLLRVGALDRWRDFLDVADVCAGYVAALRGGAKLAPGATFNLASGAPRRVGDILAALLARAGLSPRIKEAASLLRPTDVMRTACRADAARESLGWSPATSWPDTLARVLEDWRARVRAE
jgi:GDP-4-dehydro-6-deoxy-D-mannose reductase